MARGKAKYWRGKTKGFGSFCNQAPGHYSEAEQMAKQGHPDRIRTVDLMPDHRLERELADDVSQKLSDWHDRTSINHVSYKIRQEAEEDYARRRKENKCFKINKNKQLVAPTEENSEVFEQRAFPLHYINCLSINDDNDSM